jgi:tetratricopeptide (TPR) repeat protein
MNFGLDRQDASQAADHRIVTRFTFASSADLLQGDTCVTRRTPPAIAHGIDHTRRGDYLMGLTVLADFYEHDPTASDHPEGLSWYGLCLASVSRSFEHALRMCNEALAREPDRPAHHINTAMVLLLKGNRKTAIETLERAMEIHPDDEELRGFREQMGIRSKPPLPFLSRSHAVNVALGQVMYAAKRRKRAKKK